MSTSLSPLGHGQIIWLGVNQKNGGFSTPRNPVVILKNGIKGDQYRGMWREASGHDRGYIATDNVVNGDLVLNLRQITIIDEAEMREVCTLTGTLIEWGMLCENMVVLYTPVVENQKFSKIPPLSRMVIGDTDKKVLLLTEENGPCRKIVKPIIDHYQLNDDMEDVLRSALKGRRGQMAMVRTHEPQRIQVGDSFTIFPPLS